jgi:hypothetical protein
MATVYSLICWGGAAGKSATGATATDIITLTNHGIRAGTGVVPQSTVSGVTAGTIYYVYPIAASTFYLYDTYENSLVGGATGRINITATTAFILKSAYYLALSNKSRWTTDGVERIYPGITEWNAGRAGCSPLDEEVCEIGMAWTEYLSGTATLNIAIPAGAYRIETKINGVRTPAFHAGNFSTGFRALVRYAWGGLNLTSPQGLVDGFVIEDIRSDYRVLSLVLLTGFLCEARNMRIIGNEAAPSSSTGIQLFGILTKAVNCIVTGTYYGIQIYQYGAYPSIHNCITTKNVIGMDCGNTGSANGHGSSVYNNVSLGNTTLNWFNVNMTNFRGASNNLGAPGEAWVKAPGIRLETTETTPFAGIFQDFVNTLLAPASATSPLAENGIAYYGAINTDIKESYRPAYPGSNYGVAISAGSFVTGMSYTITTVGTTNFILIGASANTVGVVFKASGIGSGNGTATLNAGIDVGAYEFDLGYSGWPQTQTYTVAGAVIDRIKIAKQSDGSEIYNSTVLPDNEPSTFSASVPVYIYIRKGSAAPYYHPLKLSATIDPINGLVYDTTGLQQEDIAAHDYSATAVASDWTFDSNTGAITHALGTTRYAVRDLYSWHQDYYDGITTIDDTPLMRGITPSIFELINSGTISTAHLADLKGGSIEFGNGDLWTNLWTTDTMAAAHSIYVVQAGAKYTAFWVNGPLDILLQVSDAGVLRDSGLVDVYTRPWGYTYANYQADLSAGGSVVAPISTFVDAAITDTEVTVAGWNDIVISFGTYSLDFADGDGLRTYYCRINCNGRPLSQVYQFAQYVTRDTSVTTLNGVAGWKYKSARAGYYNNTAAPFGTYAGGLWTLAKGVWLDNVPSGDLLNYIVTDDSGLTHQKVVALNQSISITGVITGSRVQIYDTTNNIELFNSTVGPYYWEDPLAPVGDRVIRVRIHYVLGASAKEFIEAYIGTCGTSLSTKDLSYLASQQNDVTYNSNGIDGSSVTGVTFVDAAIDVMNINLTAPINLQNLYAAWVYYAFTVTGIATDIDYIKAIDVANYVYSNLIWKNTSSPAIPLKITGGYAWDANTLDPMDLIDTTGGTIFLAPPHVVSNVVTVGGVNVITGDIADVPTTSEIVTAIQADSQTLTVPKFLALKG